jgi:hypothetical protein
MNMMIAANIKAYLDDVEARIDAAQEDRLIWEWMAYCDLKCADPFFSPRRIPAPSKLEWPRVVINDAFQDMNLMLYTQLKGVSDILSGEVGLLLNVRANYGTGIIPTMFGAELFYLPDEVDTLPGTRPLEDGTDALKEVVDTGAVDYSQGLAPRVFEFGACWTELVRSYPLIRQYVFLYNPDLQGPLSLTDELAGSELFYAMYDDPEFVHRALDFMASVYLDFTAKWQALYPSFDADHSVEWGLLHKGHTILRNDTATNLSVEMYREFVMPYDQKIFHVLGGGMHFCGRGDHYIQAACELERLSCINLSQPELNDMDKIYSSTIDRGIIIIGLAAEEILRASKQGRKLRGLVQSGAAISAYRDL